MKYSLHLLKSLSHNNEIKLIHKCKDVNDNQILNVIRYVSYDIDDINRLMSKGHH